MSAAERAREVAASVRDPELPMLTLADLGVLRGVEAYADGVVVTLAPTYSGCPALAAMRADVAQALHGAGFPDVRVDVEWAPAWSSDDITPAGRAALSEAGISPPGPRPAGPTTLTLTAPRRRVRCPRCHAHDVEALSEFGPAPCRALYRCVACREPFEHMKEH